MGMETERGHSTITASVPLAEMQECTPVEIIPENGTLISDAGFFIKWTNFLGQSLPSLFYRIQRFCFITRFHERQAMENIPRMRGLCRH